MSLSLESHISFRIAIEQVLDSNLSIEKSDGTVPNLVEPEPEPKGISPDIKQAVHEFLNKFAIPYHIRLFQKIYDTNYLRLHQLVTQTIAQRPSAPDEYVKAYELSLHHAIAYALSQNPRFIAAFADYFEFYLVTLDLECLSKLNQCREQVQKQSKLETLTPAQTQSQWQTATQEILNQRYDNEESARIGIFIAEVEHSKNSEHPESINPTIQKDTERTYRMIAEKFGRRNSFGTREKLVFCSINAFLGYEDMLSLIQHHNRTNSLRFEEETTAVLQVSKYFNELPLDEQNMGRNYVDSYLRSAKTTIEHPTELVTRELDLEDNFVFIFKRFLEMEEPHKLAEARVRVTRIYGRLTLLSYAIF